MISKNEFTFETYLKSLSRALSESVQREYKFHKTRRWRFDFAWPKWEVAVEIDGIAWQAGGGRHNTDADREKINIAVSLGWHVFRFSGKQINDDPVQCVKMVENFIEFKKKSLDNGKNG